MARWSPIMYPVSTEIDLSMGLGDGSVGHANLMNDTVDFYELNVGGGGGKVSASTDLIFCKFSGLVPSTGAVVSAEASWSFQGDYVSGVPGQLMFAYTLLYNAESSNVCSLNSQTAPSSGVRATESFSKSIDSVGGTPYGDFSSADGGAMHYIANGSSVETNVWNFYNNYLKMRFLYEPIHRTVTAIGDSLTAFDNSWFSTLSHGHKIYNLSHNSRRGYDIDLRDLNGLTTDLVILASGTNDALAGTATEAEMREQLHSQVHHLVSRGHRVVICLIPLVLLNNPVCIAYRDNVQQPVIDFWGLESYDLNTRYDYAELLDAIHPKQVTHDLWSGDIEALFLA